MATNVFDLVIILTLALFIYRGARNGLIGEVAGIFALVTGFWAARSWHDALESQLGFIADPTGRVIVACALIFIAVMLAVGILARILKKILSLSFAGGIDELAGAALGLTKGILIWALIIVVLIKLFPDAPFLRDSWMLPYFRKIVALISQWLPPQLAEHLNL